MRLEVIASCHTCGYFWKVDEHDTVLMLWALLGFLRGPSLQGMVSERISLDPGHLDKMICKRHGDPGHQVILEITVPERGETR